MNKVRYGIIGIGSAGQYHYMAARENEKVEVTALCDANETALRERAAEYNIQCFTDLDAMLAAEVVDAVSIAVPHYLLCEIASKCLNAGIHVLVEKPMAVKISEADRMLAAAGQNNRKLAVNFQYRTYTTSKIIKQALDEGRIGKVYQVLWTWKNFRTLDYHENSPWHASFRSAGGGIIMYHGAHDIDLMRWYLGKPVEVAAVAANQLQRTDCEDTATIIINFESGAAATMQYGFNQRATCNIRQFAGSRGILTLPEVHTLTFENEDDILLGTYPAELKDLAARFQTYNQQPDISWQPLRRRPGKFATHSQSKLKGLALRLRLMKAPPANNIGFRAVVNDFVDSIIEDRAPMVTGEDARATLELVNAALLSAARKKTVTLPLDPKEYDEFFEEMCRTIAQ